MSAGEHLTVLGFDFGTRHIGVAVGQTVTGTARPLTTLNAQHGQPNWDDVSALVREWQPAALVLGVPVHMDGSEHERTRAARRFGNQLNGRYGLPVHWVDERLSSEEAERQLKNRGSGESKPDIDAVAAQVILQTWLDQH